MSTTEDGEVYTLNEHIDEIDKNIEETIAVVGACDESKCSYSDGYIERQAIFKCNTCDPTNENLAGVCYACSLNCHADHDLIELYTKRNFRCDCGNSKFDDFKCTLQEERDAVNSGNHYNQNFKGKYCTCHRPYPDPDDKIEDEMIQCILCEDWYHSRHLGETPPADFSEMVCDQCIKNNSFLQFYEQFSVKVEPKDANEKSLKRKHDKMEENVDIENPPNKSNTEDSDTSCFLKKLKDVNNEVPKDDLKAMFFNNSWRKELCLCETCKEMYKNLKLEYLPKESDTTMHHEMKGKEKVEGKWEDAVNSITQLDHVTKIEFMRNIQDFKEGLTDFLSKFKNGDVVKKEDVDKFMEGVHCRKKQRLETGFGIPPDTCK